MTVGCPDAETLAAFIDGRLAAAARFEMEAHVSSCASCYQVFTETARLQRENDAPGVVLPASGRFTSPKAFWSVGGLLAAAAAVMLVVRTGWFGRAAPSGTRAELVDLVAAVGANRVLEPRLSGGFAWGPVPAQLRSGNPRKLSPEIRMSIARIEQTAADRKTPEQFAALGVAQLIAGDHDEAIAALERAGNEKPDNAEFLSDLAAAYLARALDRDPPDAEKLSRAVDAAGRATRLAPSLPEPWFNRALALERIAPSETAKAAWRDYLRVDAVSMWAAEAKEHLEKLSVPRPDGATLLKQRLDDGDLRAAADFAREFPQPAREYLDEELLPEWGRIWLSGDFSTARVLLSRARRLADALEKTTGDHLAERTLGCLQAANAPIRDLAAAHVAYGAGRRAYDSDQYAEAAQAFDRAVGAFRRAGSDFWLWASVHRALVSYQQRTLDEARHRLEHVRRLAETRGYPVVAARAEWLAGVIRLQQGDPAGALRESVNAIGTFERVAEWENAISIRTTAADILRTLGDVDQGWANVSVALSRRDQLRKPIRRYLLYLNASLYASKDGLYGAGIDFLTAAVDAARERGGPGPIVDALTRRARMNLDFANEQAAADDNARAESLLDQVPAASLRNFFQARISATEGMLRRTPSEAAHEFLAKAIRFFGRVEPAQVPSLYLAESRRAQVNGRLDEAKGALEHGIDEFETRRQRLPAEEFRISYADDGWELFAEMIKLQLAQGHPELAFAFSERARARSLFERISGVQTSATRTPDDVRAFLNNDIAVLYYMVLNDRLIIWSIQRNGVRFVSIPIHVDDLTKQVGDLVSAILERKSDYIRVMGSRLYRVLIGSVPVSLPNTLAVVLDGPLYRVPFAALVDPVTGRYLVEDHAVMNLPSTRVLGTRKPDRVEHTERALVIAAPGGPAGSGAPTLREVASESADVSHVYANSHLLQGDDLDKRALFSEMSKYTVVHFAGHSIVNPDYPLLSRLVLGPGAATVFGYEIARLNMAHTRLVMLSACSTARGRTYRGEGVMGMARPFLAAGVQNVVATLWDVDDAAAHALSTTFHRAYRTTGMSSSALRAAQLEAIRARGRLSEPAGWSAFVVLSTGQQAVDGTGRQRSASDD